MAIILCKSSLCQFRNLMTFPFLRAVEIFRTNKLYDDGSLQTSKLKSFWRGSATTPRSSDLLLMSSKSVSGTRTSFCLSSRCRKSISEIIVSVFQERDDPRHKMSVCFPKTITWEPVKMDSPGHRHCVTVQPAGLLDVCAGCGGAVGHDRLLGTVQHLVLWTSDLSWETSHQADNPWQIVDILNLQRNQPSCSKYLYWQLACLAHCKLMTVLASATATPVTGTGTEITISISDLYNCN